MPPPFGVSAVEVLRQTSSAKLTQLAISKPKRSVYQSSATATTPEPWQQWRCRRWSWQQLHAWSARLQLDFDQRGVGQAEDLGGNLCTLGVQALAELDASDKAKDGTV